MDDNDYDEAMRHLARRADAPMMHWLLELDETHMSFKSWLDPVLVWPGVKERVCDLIARLVNHDRRGLPTACIIEFQTEPDARMFGRLLVAGGMCWMDVKPADLPGDRFELSAVVVNLTGLGDCARHMTLGTTEWNLKPKELNLETFDAAVVLEDIASGKAPRELLALIPIMKNGGDSGIIDRWQEIAGPEKDPVRRGDYALADLFAGAVVGRREQWRKMLEAFKMNESPVAREWRAEARSEGLRAGKIEGRTEALILALEERFATTLSAELVSRIRASTDESQLDRWLRLAVSPAIVTLDLFRQQASL
jgi:hypothetical protein